MQPVEIALRFTELGYHVFPLYRGGNGQKLKPFGWAKNEVQDPEKLDKAIPATNEVLVVATWPDLVRKKYNSEVVGFGVLGLDCVIIDADAKDGKPGLTEFQQMIDYHGVPKPSMITVTKSGGLHLYYRRPDVLKDAYVKTIAGVVIGNTKFSAVDLRGNGGFVVGPEKLVEDLHDRQPGQYVMKGLKKYTDLPEFPTKVLNGWLRTHTGDLDNLISLTPQEDDYRSQIRRGQIPDFIPKGARNESFFLLANILKSKGVPVAAARQMMMLMAQKCEEPETLHESVDIEDILTRAYVVKKDSPYDVAVDLIDKGLFQLTNYKPKLHYVILEDNPYIASKTPHDEATMKTLLAKFQRTVQTDGGKSKIVNPMDVVPKIIHDENRADTMGFKPNSGTIFRMHNDPGSRRFLNTYRPVIIPDNDRGLDPTIWEEFIFLISRIFGEKGSDEYQLGLDFVAWLIQCPQIKPSIAPFIMSHRRGVGKSLFFNVIVQILGTSKDGERQGKITKLDELSGRFFNPANCVLNLIDEVQFPVHRDARKESVTFWRHMKNLITAETVSVEIKGGSTYQAPNSAALMLAGNSGGNFPIEEFDRRLWIVDNNPPILERGMCDKLFAIVKGLGAAPDDLVRFVQTLRYGLYKHEIKMELDAVRAPMTDVKREMFLNSITDVEEWYISHFEDHDSLFARTPVISKSAFFYVVSTSDPLRTSKWKEDVEALFRDLKRRGYLRPIRNRSNNTLSRQFMVPMVSNDGKMHQGEKREVLYTTRDHGAFDALENNEVIHAYMQNAHTIKFFKGELMRGVAKTLQGGTDVAFEEPVVQ